MDIRVGSREEILVAIKKTRQFIESNGIPVAEGDFKMPIGRSANILAFAKHCADLPGNVAEVGVASGQTTLLMAKALPKKTIYAFDTFEGFAVLPEIYFAPPGQPEEDDLWRTWGSNLDGSAVIELLQSNDNIEIRKGVFPDTTKGLKDERFSLVHLDADIYYSTLLGLEFFYPRMVMGGVIIIDDCDVRGEKFPRVYGAVVDFFTKQKIPAKIVQSTDLQGVIIVGY